MNQKILIGSIFTALLLLTMPFVSAIQERQTDIYLTKTSEPQIRDLQYAHDYIAENYPEEFDEGFLQEFQDNINTLNLEDTDVCVSLGWIYLALIVLLAWYYTIGNFFMSAVVFSLIIATVAMATILNCEWTDATTDQDGKCMLCENVYLEKTSVESKK